MIMMTNNKCEREEEVVISDDDEDDEIFEKVAAAAEIPVNISIPSISYTLMEFISDVWISNCSAQKNLRLIIAYLSRILATLSGSSDPESTRRRRECVEMRSALMDLLTAWVREGPIGEMCSKDTLHRYLAEYRDKRLSADREDPFSTLAAPKDRTTFAQMTMEYKDYVSKMFDSRRKRLSGIKVTCNGDHAAGGISSGKRKREQEEEEVNTESSSSVEEEQPLFDSSIFIETEKRRIEDSGNVLQQFVIKMDNDGSLYTWKTPGEIGNTVIRVEVYRMKDIIKKERRTWWKSARLRAQFLSQDSCPRKLTELLNEVATQMSKVPGLVSEKRNV